MDTIEPVTLLKDASSFVTLRAHFVVCLELWSLAVPGTGFIHLAIEDGTIV